ncbi:MAG: hypothetical protein ACREJ3_13970, partial [Polyangiaceae bacterium]
MVRISQSLFAAFALSSATAVCIAVGCGGSSSNPFGGGLNDASTSGFGGTGSNGADGSNGSSGSGSSGGGFGSGANSGSSGSSGKPTGPCSGLGCSVNYACANGGHTTLTGTVYDPAGKNPIYNAVVFVPDDVSQLQAIKLGTNSCNTCDTPIGNYVAVAQTDVKGHFTLNDVPTGKNVPLVVQIGKWRRVVTVPSIADCATTTVASSGTGQARLPRNHTEGSMPAMALLTGGLDDLGCFMRRMGIDDGEYSAPHGGGRLDIYQGNGLLGPAPGLSSGGTAGNCTGANCGLWSTKADLENYDIVLLACEGDTYENAKPTTAKQALDDWLNEGGKVFTTHFQYVWFQNNPDPKFQQVATWLGTSVGIGMPNATIDTSFPKGQVLHDWLQNIGALTGPGGTIALNGVATSVSAVNAATPTSRWIYDSSSSDTKYLSFETPIGGTIADAGPEMGKKTYCGKAVFSDLHAGGAPKGDVPAACDPPGNLTPQEEALEFL